MLFPTIEFFLFFVVVFAASWALNVNNLAKKFFLVVASYFFYAQWDWRFIFLLGGVSITNYLLALVVQSAREGWKKPALALTIALNLANLAFFKYYDFLAAQISNLLALVHVKVDLGSPNVALPVGISFLTFHAISYSVDVYRGKTQAAKSPLDVMLYMAFFPHLVAGPIVRAADFFWQLAKAPAPAAIKLGPSLWLILGGLFKKVVIASHLSTLVVDPAFSDPSAYASADLVFAAAAYAIVIFCDFSAYTDMAIGIANLLGYQFPQNFNQPYRSISLSEFWRRWHMSLSSWLRDYLYIPLGGNRHGELKTYRNLMVTMLLGGLWHGAGLQFIVWGGLHGLGLAFERLVGLKDDGGKKAIPVVILRWAGTFAFVCIAWVFFRSPSLSDALDYFKAIGAGSGSGALISPFVVGLLALGFATQFTPQGLIARVKARLTAASPLLQAGLAFSMIWVSAVLAPAGIPPFIYFQF